VIVFYQEAFNRLVKYSYMTYQILYSLVWSYASLQGTVRNCWLKKNMASAWTFQL